MCERERVRILRELGERVMDVREERERGEEVRGVREGRES